MTTNGINWTEFDAANGRLAIAQLEAVSPAHVQAVKNLLKSGATEQQIITRFVAAFPTWEAHTQYLRLAVRHLREAE